MPGRATPSYSLQLLRRLTEYANNLHDAASLASFLVFLVNGRYRTLTDRFLRLRLVPTSYGISREVSFEYLNRQLVWHAFTEFLLFLLPLVGVARWRRILTRAWRKIHSAVLTFFGFSSQVGDRGRHGQGSPKKQGTLSFLPTRTCAICYADQNLSTVSEADALAHFSSAGGGHRWLRSNRHHESVSSGPMCMRILLRVRGRSASPSEEGEGWLCLRCSESVSSCRPWSGDVLQGAAPTGAIAVGPATSPSIQSVDLEEKHQVECDWGNGDVPHSTAEHAASSSIDDGSHPARPTHELRAIDPIPELDPDNGVSISGFVATEDEYSR